MRKRTAVWLLVLSLLLSLVIPAYAQEETQTEGEEPIGEAVESKFLDIHDPDGFLTFAEACRLDSFSVGLVVTLKRDIDLSGLEFSGIPIFSGYFNGDGHSVKGLDITGDGSSQGLFRYLTPMATVTDLTVEGTVAPGGSANAVGIIAGENLGTVSDCAVDAVVSGNSRVGGIVGINGVSGLIEDCTVRGQVDGTHFIGGVAGENSGVIRNCSNHAQINTVARQNTVELSEITVESITDSEAANTATDIGGIAGISTGVIRKCRNMGPVGYPHMGFNVGGIAGTQSGHIADCTNRADIHGRKEVGGIVGQMEPISYVEFSVDTLQLLKEQLGAMSGLVDKASVNASGSAGAMAGQIGVLQGQTNTAVEAIETLITTDKTDTDALLAAQNTLTTTLGQMPGTVERIAGAAQAMVGGLSRDFKIISEHIAVMSETLNEASENIGGTLTDISDLDTEELLSGKVLRCFNAGSVSGDMDVGGIAGAMAVENDMDVLEDWSFTGEESMNFDSKIRAVILSCENYGAVTGGKQNIGGIVGLQSLGLVRSSVWVGSVKSSGADYVGGVSGFSIGYIRECYAKGEIAGSTCVGGIAGLATVTTDCVSAVRIDDASERSGAILGVMQETDRQEEEPVSGNLYLPTGKDIGAIDGISYDGKAQSVTLEVFNSLTGLPYALRRVNVRFVFEDGTVRDIELLPGEALEQSRIPRIPDKHGFTGEWEGLADADLSHILHDMTFTLRYGPHGKTVQSVSQEQGRPLVLAEGLFGFDAALDVVPEEEEPALPEGTATLRTGQLQLSGEAQVTAVHLLLPEDEDLDPLTVWILDSNGAWRKVSHRISGSYAVFDWSEGDISFALIREEADMAPGYYAAAAGAVILVGLAVLIAVRIRRKKRQSEGSSE